MNGLMLIAQAGMETTEQSGGFLAALPGLIVMGIIAFAVIGGLWKLFEKAGQPGWAALVPIYNMVVLLKVADKPVWWIVLFFIPLANVIALFLVAFAVADRFGKGAGYGLGIAFFPYVFYPILGFGSARYQRA